MDKITGTPDIPPALSDILTTKNAIKLLTDKVGKGADLILKIEELRQLQGDKNQHIAEILGYHTDLLCDIEVYDKLKNLGALGIAKLILENSELDFIEELDTPIEDGFLVEYLSNSEVFTVVLDILNEYDPKLFETVKKQLIKKLSKMQSKNDD